MRDVATTLSIKPLSIVLLLIAGIAIGAAGFWIFVRPTPQAAVSEESHEGDAPMNAVEIPASALQNAGIEIVSVARQRMPNTLNVTGIVTPDESRVAHVRPLARGVVERINVTLGSRVAAGQALLTYDNIQLGQLIGEYLTQQSVLRQAETDREVKRTALDRAEALIKIEGIAQRELDVRGAEFRNAEAAVASAEARISQTDEQLHRFGLSDPDIRALRPGADEAPHREASHSVLRAPFAGVITKFDVAIGEIVEPEKEVFTVADISTVWVLADVYEKDIAKVRPEGTVTVTADAYPDRTFTGRVAYVSDLIDSATRAAKVRCVVDNRDGALKLDMFAKVALGTLGDRETLLVPSDAVQQVDGQPVVFVRRSPTQFERRDIEIGRREGTMTEVLGGVESGQQVVGKGSFYLKTALLRERIGNEH